MKKLGAVRIIVSVVLLLAVLGIFFVPIMTKAAAVVGPNPFNLPGIRPVEAGAAKKVVQTADGKDATYENGEKVYVYNVTVGGETVEAVKIWQSNLSSPSEVQFFNKALYEGESCWPATTTEDDVEYGYVKYTENSTGTFYDFEQGEYSNDDIVAHADFAGFFLNKDVTNAQATNEDGEVVIGYATVGGYENLYVYETDAPWLTGVKDVNGTAITEASLLGQTVTIKDPNNNYATLTVSIPAAAGSGALKDKKWEDLTADEKAAYTTTQADKELAVALYYLANANYIGSDYSGFYANCATSNIAAGMDNQIDLNIVETRSQGIMYRQDYRVEKAIPLTALMSLETLASLGLELTCGERRFYAATESNTLDHCMYERSTTAKLTEEGYTTDWTSQTKQINIDPSVYRKLAMSGEKVDGTYENKFANSMKNADGTAVYPEPGTLDSEALKKQYEKDVNYEIGAYQFLSHTVAIDTIKTAYVSFADGKFNMYIQLDVKTYMDGKDYAKAVQNTINGIRKGAGDLNANYENIELIFSLWGNGYYENCQQIEKWTGIAAGFDVAGNFYYYYTFMYGENNIKEPMDRLIGTWDAANTEYVKATGAAA